MKDELFSILIQWYRMNRKPLPWREDPSPYHVWISEIMLQQTRVEAVIPYYHRFLEALPTVEDLADCDDDRLMKLWEGLGYYSRARNLKKAAQAIVSDYGGALPSTAAELLTLPGIGPYTAGAIASIAYGEPEPAVDGNVLRVISRLTASAEDIALDGTKRKVSEELRAHYPTGTEAGLLTEALMELGETVCLPNGEPKCALCPVGDRCQAYLSGTVDRYPVKSGKKPRRMEDRTVLLIQTGDVPPLYVIRRRKEKGLLHGLWEFPNFPGKLGLEELCGLIPGFTAEQAEPLGEAKHIFTHVEWYMIGYRLTGKWNVLPEDYVQVLGSEIDEVYAIPTAFRKYTEQIIR